jgi:hypothetical protein
LRTFEESTEGEEELAVEVGVCEKRGAGAEIKTSRTANKEQHRNTARFISRPLRCIDSAFWSHTARLLPTPKTGFTGTRHENETEIIRGASAADVLKFFMKKITFYDVSVIARPNYRTSRIR